MTSRWQPSRSSAVRLAVLQAPRLNAQGCHASMWFRFASRTLSLSTRPGGDLVEGVRG